MSVITWQIEKIGILKRCRAAKILDVRRHHNDLTFLDEFLTPEFCAQQRLFTFENNPRARQWQIASTEFKEVKTKMLAQLTNMGQPIIKSMMHASMAVNSYLLTSLGGSTR